MTFRTHFRDEKITGTWPCPTPVRNWSFLTVLALLTFYFHLLPDYMLRRSILPRARCNSDGVSACQVLPAHCIAWKGRYCSSLLQCGRRRRRCRSDRKFTVACAVCVKLHLRDKDTQIKRQKDKSFSFCLSPGWSLTLY